MLTLAFGWPYSSPAIAKGFERQVFKNILSQTKETKWKPRDKDVMFLVQIEQIKIM